MPRPSWWFAFAFAVAMLILSLASGSTALIVLWSALTGFAACALIAAFDPDREEKTNGPS